MRGEGNEVPLSGYRVLDLTDRRGWLCGRIFGDLKPDVIRVGNPASDSGRNLIPSLKDATHGRRSLSRFTSNASDGGITPSLETADGQYLLKDMVAKPDFLVVSFPTGYLDGSGPGYNKWWKGVV
jgi:crotonobetainyl-CoA:carnitine CoA-transferase CaiB-like acyl-CoA transferase